MRAVGDSNASEMMIYPDASEAARSYTDRGQLETFAVSSTTVNTRGYDNEAG